MTPDVGSRVTVLLVTYNQERYLGEALDSLLLQDIDGGVNVVVADDASSDGTLRVLEPYRYKDPRFSFTVLDHAANRGITRNYQRAFAACRTEYVAVLEGDDYWTSPGKLRTQRAYLDEHPDSPMCGVNYLIYEESKGTFTPRTPPGHSTRLLTAQDQIADNLASNFSTCMYRAEALHALPTALFETTSYDWIVNICVGQLGRIGFIEEPMSVYRLHPGGVWTSTSYVDQLKSQLEVIPTYDALTQHAYRAEFSALAERLGAQIAQLEAASSGGGSSSACARRRSSFFGRLKRAVGRQLSGGAR